MKHSKPVQNETHRSGTPVLELTPDNGIAVTDKDESFVFPGRSIHHLPFFLVRVR